MKRIAILLLLLVEAIGSPSNIFAKNEKAKAVGTVVYVLEATSEKPGLVLPIFPNTVSVSVLESMVSNVEDLQQQVEKVYKYSHLTLLKSWRNLFLLTEKERTATQLDLQTPNIAIQFQLSYPREQLPVFLSVQKGGKELSRISYLANWAKTIVVGFPFPNGQKGTARALFIATTFWEKDVHGPQDYTGIVDFYKSLTLYVPPGPEDVKTFKAVRHFFSRQYGMKKFPEEKSVSVRRLEVNSKTARGEATFASYDVPPQPIGGFQAIQKNLVYPENARKKHIQGTVILHVLLDENGQVLKTKVLKGATKELNSAAIQAVRQTKWKPALRKEGGKERPVKVWISVPIVFRLRQ